MGGWVKGGGERGRSIRIACVRVCVLTGAGAAVAKHHAEGLLLVGAHLFLIVFFGGGI